MSGRFFISFRHTAWLETDEHGRFAYSFNETTTTPGLHSVLIHATADGRWRENWFCGYHI